ncbi:hypothetical protein GCM10011586_37390 [Silvibacterium dinghuense]|nr:hypothetical protein GCM10011586_37390 [Silvibacterium dinghuense]
MCALSVAAFPKGDASPRLRIAGFVDGFVEKVVIPAGALFFTLSFRPERTGVPGAPDVGALGWGSEVEEPAVSFTQATEAWVSDQTSTPYPHTASQNWSEVKPA